MEIYTFDYHSADVIRAYGSLGARFLSLVSELANASVGVMDIAPGGKVGYHEAIGDQLFLVVQGSGWVSSMDRKHRDIEAGQAALWHAGEWHESGSEAGMTAVIIEADRILLAP